MTAHDPRFGIEFRGREGIPRSGRRSETVCCCILGLAGMTVSLACDSGGEPAPTVYHFIVDDPSEKFDHDDLLERVNVFEWQLQSGGRGAWSTRDEGARFWRTRDGLGFRSAGKGFGMTRPADFDTASVAAIEVVINGLKEGELELFWARAGERFSAARRISVAADCGLNGIYRFDLAGHPHWTGRIDRISINPRSSGRQEVELRSLIGFHERIVSHSLEAALRRPWKVELERETRGAFLAVPGTVISREFWVSPGSCFRYSYAADPRVRQTLRFSIRGGASGTPPARLVEHVWIPGASSGWQEGSIDLGTFSSKMVQLTLEVASDEPFDPQPGVLYWGDPSVIPPARSGGLNVIVISVDTLRSDHMSVYGYGRSTTPLIGAWARRNAIVFQRAVASAPWTLPSHASLFAGVSATRHGLNYSNRAVPSSMEMLAERFREAGYQTFGTSAGGYLDPEYGWAQGFDVYRTREERPTKPSSQDELEQGVAEVIRWIDGHRWRPFFVFFHTYEVHGPYLAREPYFRAFGGDVAAIPEKPSGADAFKEADGSPRDTELLATLYDSGIAYMDEHVGQILEFLAGSGLDASTIVVITSDHGEALGEHQLVGHSYLYDDNLMIPLIIALPSGRQGGTVIEEQVRSVDVSPTLLALTGLRPLRDADGHSLAPFFEGTGEARDAWSYAPHDSGAIALRLANDLKYIFHNDIRIATAEAHELYDLKNDPTESNNLAVGSPQSQSLHLRALEHLRESIPGLRIRFSNMTDEHYRGSLEGSMLMAPALTSPDLPSRCLEWNGANTVVFSVPPSTRFTLFAENYQGGGLVVRVHATPTSKAFEFSVDPASLSDPIRFRFDGSQPQRVDVESEVDDDGITIWWTNNKARAENDLVQADESLSEQLRALGYIR